MKRILLFVVIIFSLTKTQAQCDIVETITICDMTIVDGNSDGTPDGIINLYDAYNALPGVTPISIVTGAWFDPNFNFALDELTGDLYLWDLDDSSENITDYQFQLIDTNSACPNGILITVNLVLGPFEGNPLPPVGPNDANITVCEAVLSDFDLFQVFESQPSPHENGIWTFVGNLGDPSNFMSLSQDGSFRARIPYVPGGNLIEFDVFEFSYTVPGVLPCSPSNSVNFKVEVIRDIDSGTPNSFQICETDILSGIWDADIDLRDDAYLANEDIEGLWSSINDPTGQISDPLDSTINIREVYDFLKANNPNFGCASFTYTYSVEARSTLTDCEDKSSEITFSFFEPIKPFQQNQPLQICVGGVNPSSANLYDELTFTTENGVLYDYPNNTCTNWQFVSGPSDLGIVSNMGDICVLESPIDDFYTYRGTINLANLTNADAGTYVFRYMVSPSYTCTENSCNGQSGDVTVIIHPFNYAGEDTTGLQFCETDPTIANPLDLFTLLTTNGVDDPIYQGPLGTWVDLSTGSIVTNPVTLPNVDGQQTFNYLYSTTTSNNCVDRASLSFTVFEEYQSGIGSSINVCDNNASFDLFDNLTGNPNTNGTWTGPNGYISATHNAMFTPGTSDAGDYIYTVPDNVDALSTVLCSGNSATITVVNHQSPNAGTGGDYSVCRSDLQIDLVDYLDASADSSGVFRDLDTGNLLPDSLLDVSQLAAGTYHFQYEIQGHASCHLSTSQISITVVEVPSPIVTDQIFCASVGATVLNLVAINGTSFNWYDTIDDTTLLSIGTVLIDGEDYFVAAVDADGCESPRIGITVTLLPLNHIDCDTCFKDGISVNGDGENDAFDLCGLPLAFPNFEINMYNRYGSKVYKGNKNTSLFNGVSNVSLTIGKELPSGVYFYVFDPKDGSTAPTQGNFYLSR